MTVGIVLIKGLPGRFEHTHEFLIEMKEKKALEKEKNVRIKEVYLSMGWPDIILLLEGGQILDIHEAIAYIKNQLKERKKEYRDLIDTSTIVCIEREKREKIKKELADYSAKFDL